MQPPLKICNRKIILRPAKIENEVAKITYLLLDAGEKMCLATIKMVKCVRLESFYQCAENYEIEVYRFKQLSKQTKATKNKFKQMEPYSHSFASPTACPRVQVFGLVIGHMSQLQTGKAL